MMVGALHCRGIVRSVYVTINTEKRSVLFRHALQQVLKYGYLLVCLALNSHPVHGLST
jgi:hypothetical protein